MASNDKPNAAFVLIATLKMNSLILEFSYILLLPPQIKATTTLFERVLFLSVLADTLKIDFLCRSTKIKSDRDEIMIGLRQTIQLVIYGPIILDPEGGESPKAGSWHHR